MIQLKLLIMVLVLSLTTLASGPELSPENLATASLRIAFDRNVKLSERNDFRFPIAIDPYNKCFLTTLHPTVRKKISIPENTEWKTETNSNWNDWDSKTYSFKLIHSNENFLMKCELHLGGEVVLFNGDMLKKRVKSQCAKQGGRLKKTPVSYSFKKHSKGRRAPASAQGYCVKRIPKVTVAKLTSAFRKSNLNLNIEFPPADDVSLPISSDLLRPE